MYTAASCRNPKANNTILNSVIEVFNNEVQTGIKNQEKAQVDNQNELKSLQNPLKWRRDLEQRKCDTKNKWEKMENNLKN